MATRIAEVRYNVENNHQVALTAQMQSWLDDFLNGERKASPKASTTAFTAYSVPAPTVEPASRKQPSSDKQRPEVAPGPRKMQRLSDL